MLANRAFLRAIEEHQGFMCALRQGIRPHTLRFANYVELALRNEDVDRLAEFIETRCKQGC
jgi:hypothetical protein